MFLDVGSQEGEVEQLGDASAGEGVLAGSGSFLATSRPVRSTVTLPLASSTSTRFTRARTRRARFSTIIDCHTVSKWHRVCSTQVASSSYSSRALSARSTSARRACRPDLCRQAQSFAGQPELEGNPTNGHRRHP